MTGPAAGHPIDASVIVVGDGDQVETVVAALAGTGWPSVEVVVVTGDTPAPGTDRELAGARTVTVPASTSWSASANRGAALATGWALCFVAPGTRPLASTEAWLGPLLAALRQDPVAVAVPQVVNPAERAGPLDLD
ncbi:MAG: hypothetical protein ACRD0N_10590, partial [Acidimicrobiales bacterium]